MSFLTSDVMVVVSYMMFFESFLLFPRGQPEYAPDGATRGAPWGYGVGYLMNSAMALKVASLGASSPIVIDDEACVAKSFPDFLTLFCDR